MDFGPGGVLQLDASRALSRRVRVGDARVGDRGTEWRTVDATCPDCRAGYEVSYRDVLEGGRLVQCGRCWSAWRIFRLGEQPGGEGSPRLVRCGLCQASWEISAAAVASDAEVRCLRCAHHFRPSHGPPDPHVEAAESYRGHVGRIVFGQALRSESRPTMVFGAGPGGASQPPARVSEPALPVPRGPLQAVRCGNCSLSFSFSAEELAAGVSCPECQHPLGRPVAPRTMLFREVPDRLARELVRCEVCGTTYVVDAHVVTTAAQVQCTRCLHVFAARRPGAPDGLPPNGFIGGSHTALEAAIPSVPASRIVAAPPEVPDPPPQLPPVLQAPPFRTRQGFIGVTAARAGKHLLENGRRLPIDVWLGLADRLMAALERVDLLDAFWSRWTGPHGFGVDLDDEFVAFNDTTVVERPAGTFHQVARLHEDWVHPTLAAHRTYDEVARARVWAVCRALVWLLDPFPTLMDGPNTRLERVFEHPQLPAALHAVLDAGLALTGPADVTALRAAVRSAMEAPPATMQRVTAVLFAVGFETPEPDELPPKWRDGVLQVHLDQLLERAEPIERCPADPRAQTSNPIGMPLKPTRTLELTMRTGGHPIRKLPVTAALGFPQRIALPHNTVLAAGDPVDLELTHPEQRAFRVTLEATVGADGFATPVIDTRTKAELEVLLSSLDAEAPAPALVPPRPVPARPLALQNPLHALFGSGWLLLISAVIALFATLPIVLVAGGLALFGVISGLTLLWVALGSFAALTGMIAYGIASRPEGTSHWDDD